MDEFDACAIWRELDFDFFLDTGRGFNRLNEPRLSFVILNGDPGVVWEIRANSVFGRVPEPVSAIKPPFITAALAKLFVVFLQKILAADESQPDHARTDIGRDDQFDFTV